MAAKALVATQYKQGEVEGDSGPEPRTAPDHIILQSRLASGTALSLETAAGRPPEATPYVFEVTGETGVLVLEGGAPRGLQLGGMRPLLNGEEQGVEQGELAGMSETAGSASSIYAMLCDDINARFSIVPGFDHAVRLTRLVDDLLDCSRPGVRTSATDWPWP